MKKILPFLTLAICTLFVSCNKPQDPNGGIWDIVPSRVVMTITDQYGADLLSEKTYNSVREKPIYVIYKDKRYDMTVENRAIMPAELGLRLYFDESLKCYALWFGEFDSQDDYQNDSFTLHFDDNQSHYIRFSISTKWVMDDQVGYKVPEIHRSVSVSGSLFDNTNHAPIVYSRSQYAIWDFYPAIVSISIVDKNGVDLLDPAAAGTLRDKPIYVTYKEQRHDLATAKSDTRAILTEFNGLWLGYDKELKRNALMFGEFNVSKNYQKEPFTLYYGGGKSQLITFDAYVTWEYNESTRYYDPTVHRNLYIGSQVYADTLCTHITIE